MIYVDDARCTGCGLCIDACPTAAIRIVNGVAQVDQHLCRECEACLSACPESAILAVQEPVVAEKSAPIPAPAQPVAPRLRPDSGVWPWLGTALSFVGREIVPRVVTLLSNRGQTQPAQSGTGLSSRAAGTPERPGDDSQGRGRRARQRRRGRW
jgi:NAD-dependent dihydropyrimidine dehydrogenase PreA subunit